MSFSHQVSIGPEFFKKAFYDYANRYWAFVREILQNSIDCGSNKIEIEVVGDGTLTSVRVRNNGTPMTKEILLEKLLSLGSSGKGFTGTVGGFGKAKEILYFAHQQYSIHTGNHVVMGSGAGYNYNGQNPYVHGTESFVTWEDNVKDELLRAFRRYITLVSPEKGITFQVNGEKVRPSFGQGEYNRDLGDWSKVYTLKANKNLLLVRVNGVPMFTQECAYKHTVIIELNSSKSLTSNRDGLRYTPHTDLTKFLAVLAVDKRTALVRENAEYIHYRGPHLGIKKGSKEVSIQDFLDQMAGVVACSTVFEGADHANVTPKLGILTDIKSEQADDCPMTVNFYIKNCLAKEVPDPFKPATFSDNSKWLVEAWARCLVKLHEDHRLDMPFSVGFIFDKETIAQCEQSQERGLVYFINPALLKGSVYGQRFKKKDRYTLLATAAHEFVHGGLKQGYHDEDFASSLTDTMAFIFKHMTEFNKCLS
jgi:hypothetical protein